MSSKKQKLAFPGQTFERGYNKDTLVYHSGMTLRDYIAIQAMQAYITANGLPFNLEACASISYQMADKMIEESKKESKQDE